MNHEERTKNHPYNPHHHLYIQYPRRDDGPTRPTLTLLHDVGNNWYELIPVELFTAGEALASACPERAPYSWLHQDARETSDANTDNEKNSSEQ